MRTRPHALQTERIALPRRLVPRRPTDYAQDPRYAYLQWLRTEADLLQIELGFSSERELSPRGTLAQSYHFPPGENWRDQPQPSTRAEQVLRAVGVNVPTGLLVAEDAA